MRGADRTVGLQFRLVKGLDRGADVLPLADHDGPRQARVVPGQSPARILTCRRPQLGSRSWDAPADGKAAAIAAKARRTVAHSVPHRAQELAFGVEEGVGEQ